MLETLDSLTLLCQNIGSLEYANDQILKYPHLHWQKPPALDFPSSFSPHDHEQCQFEILLHLSDCTLEKMPGLPGHRHYHIHQSLLHMLKVSHTLPSHSNHLHE